MLHMGLDRYLLESTVNAMSMLMQIARKQLRVFLSPYGWYSSLKSAVICTVCYNDNNSDKCITGSACLGSWRGPITLYKKSFPRMSDYCGGQLMQNIVSSSYCIEVIIRDLYTYHITTTIIVRASTHRQQRSDPGDVYILNIGIIIIVSNVHRHDAKGGKTRCNNL